MYSRVSVYMMRKRLVLTTRSHHLFLNSVDKQRTIILSIISVCIALVVCLSAATVRHVGTSGDEPSFPVNIQKTSSYDLDVVDSISFDGAGSTSDFAYMQDYNSGTHATLWTDASGLEQVFQFSGIDPDWSNVQIVLGIDAGDINVYVYADTNPWPTTGGSLYGSIAGTYSINIGVVTGGSCYIRFHSVTTTVHYVYINSLSLRCSDNTAPTWNKGLMPAENQWYSSNPSLHVRFDDDCMLYSGWCDVNDWAGTSDWMMFGNLYQPSWERTAWTMPASEWSGCAQGSNTLYFYVEQTGGNPGGGLGAWSWQFNKDTNAPGAPTNVQSGTHVTSTWSSNTQVGVTWTAASDGSSGSGIAGYCISWSKEAKNPGDVVNSTGTSATSPVLSDGNNWYFNIKARDNVGFWSTTVSLGPFYIDSNNPTISGLSCSTHTVGTWSASTIITVSWTGADGTGSGIAGYSTLWAGTPTDPGTSATTTSLSSETIDTDSGTWYFNIRAKDNANHWSSTYSSIGPFLCDELAPEVVAPACSTHVAGTWSSSTQINVSWVRTTDYGGSGIAGYACSWTVDHPTSPGTTITTNQTSLNATLTDGRWYFNIRAVDRVGQWCINTSIGPFNIDASEPSFSTLPISSTHDVNNCTSLQAISVSWAMANDMGGSGIMGYSFSWSEGLIPGIADMMLDGNVTSNSTTLTDGRWWFNIRSCDNVGHWSNSLGLGPFIIDTIAPVITGTTSVDIIAGTSESIIWLNTIEMNPKNYTVLINGSVVNSSLPWNVAGNLAITINALEVGTYNVTVIVQDEAGHVSTHVVLVRVQSSFVPWTDMLVIIGALVGGALLLGLVLVQAKRKSKKSKLSKQPRNDEVKPVAPERHSSETPSTPGEGNTTTGKVESSKKP